MAKNQAGYNVYTMSRIFERLMAYAQAGDVINKNAFLIVGSPGTGKTYAPNKLAKTLGWNLVEIPVGFQEKGDNALPVPDLKNGTFNLVPAQIWQSLQPNTVVVLDEWLNADERALQALRAAYPGGAPVPNVAGHVLPENLLWVLTGNPVGAGGKNVTPLSNPAERARVRIMQVDEDPPTMANDWVKNFAMLNGVDVRIIGFIQRNSKFIIGPPPKDPMMAYPNPRAWTMASTFLAHDDTRDGLLSKADVKEGVNDTVGEEAAMALWEDMRKNLLAPPEDYLSGKTPLPGQMQAATLAIVSVARFVVDNALSDQQLMPAFFSIATPWPKEGVAVGLSLFQNRPLDWWDRAGGLQQIEDHPDFIETHYEALSSAESMWRKADNLAKMRKAGVAPKKR